MRTAHIEISRRMLLKFVTFRRVIITSDIFHRTDFVAINLEVCLNNLQKKHCHCLARDIRQVIHLLNSGKHITVCAKVFIYNYFCIS
jgi:predicted transport protein